MAYRSDRSGFTVAVDGGFAESNRWVVRGSLLFSSDLSDRDRSAIEAEAGLDLTMGIVRESLRGRDLGARTFQIVLEGDRKVAGFSLAFDSGDPSRRAA